MAEFRYILQAVPSGEFIDLDAQLSDVSFTESINAPGSISATLPIEFASLKKANGQLAISEFGTMIHIERDGDILISAIVDMIEMDNDQLILQAGGFSMLANELPWLGTTKNYIKADPLDILRDIWNHIQSYPSGDLGIVVDPLKSPIRIGEKASTTEFTTKAGEDVSFESGPLQLNWWSTDNLQTVINDLVDNTPFEYQEHSYWSGDEIKYQLKLGYPSIGSRKENLRFEIGQNALVPRLAIDDYYSEVLQFGAGEGSARVRGHLTAKTDKLRRVKVTTDGGLTSSARAESAARPLLKEASGNRSIDALTVIDHPLAPLGTFAPGDEVRVVGDAGWADDIDLWVRILELTSTPDNNNISLKVETL